MFMIAILVDSSPPAIVNCKSQQTFYTDKGTDMSTVQWEVIPQTKIPCNVRHVQMAQVLNMTAQRVHKNV